MSVVERPPAPRLPQREKGVNGRMRMPYPGGSGPASDARWHWGIAVAGLLAVAFALRVWGIGHGLPYAYNADENAHFVTRAIGLFGHDWNPQYFVNPPAYTYLTHIVLAVGFGGRAGVSEVFAEDPTRVWIVARLLCAVLATLAVWLLYLAGARLIDRRTGLLAAGIFAVSFLPVFYSHLALNDAPTLAPVCFALWAIAGVLRYGRRRDYALAGIGLGLACATKYTGGIVLLAFVAAAGAQWAAPGGTRPALRGMALAAGAALAAFLVANPYALTDFGAFFNGVTHQSDASGDTAGKLGLTQDNGYLYYLWSLGWGLGYVPMLFAAGGAVRLWRDERRLVWLLVPAVVFFVVFMGSQERYFGRWLMPVLPIVCLLAAYGALEAADWAGRLRPALRPTFIAVAVVAACGQGLVYSLHSGLVLSREDTRSLARDWMVDNVPEGTKVVIEPVVPDQWAQDIGNPSLITSNGNRWVKYPTSRSKIDPRTGARIPGEGAIVNIEDFERVLRPELVDLYEDQGYCWVVVGSTQRGRAEAEPEAAPGAIAYYRELDRRGDVAYEASPYVKGKGPVEFNFDWTFDYYPLAYHRPGPEMTVYHLTGGRCS